MAKKNQSLKDLLATYQQLLIAPKSKNMVKYVQKAKEQFYESIYKVFERYAIDPKDDNLVIDKCIPKLIDDLIQYYSEIEEYEKCNYLMKYKVKYINPILNMKNEGI
jgi:hypothetical protein